MSQAYFGIGGMVVGRADGEMAGTLTCHKTDFHVSRCVFSFYFSFYWMNSVGRYNVPSIEYFPLTKFPILLGQDVEPYLISEAQGSLS